MRGRSGRHARGSGFGLIELMVAIALGLLLVAASSALYLGSRQTYVLRNDLSQIQESGRFALELIGRDLRQAGYWGNMLEVDAVNGTDAPVAAANSCPEDNRWGRMIELALAGLDDPGEPQSAYACIVNDEFLRGDIVTVRSIDSQSPAAADPLLPNRLYLRTTPFQGRMFTGTNAADPGNSLNDVLASTHALVSHAYFVGPTASQCRGQPVPGLFRKTLDDAGVPVSEEVVSGIEQLQIRYGIDTDGDGIVNQYVDADAFTATADWNRVMSVRLWVLARSECPNAEQTDARTYVMGDQNYTPGGRFNRQLYSTTVTIRN